MMPAPMMVIVFGTWVRLRAPVEEMKIFSSNWMPGKGVGSEPVAIKMFLAFTDLLPPAIRETSTVELLAIFPHPKESEYEPF